MVSVFGLLVGGAFLVIGLVKLGSAGSELRTVYHILRDDPVAVRELPTRSGPVEIEGTAATPADQEPISSIFTETDCLAYEYEVEEYRSSGKHSSWHTLDRGSDHVPFVVRDGTGTVRVRPENAEFRFEEETIRVDGGERPPERIREFIDATDAVDFQNKSLDIVVTELDYGNDQKFVERRLEPGEDVYVYGTVGRAQGGEWGSGLVDAAVEDGRGIPEFVVSDTTEAGTVRRIRQSAFWSGLVGLLLAGVGVVAILAFGLS